MGRMKNSSGTQRETYWDEGFNSEECGVDPDFSMFRMVPIGSQRNDAGCEWIRGIISRADV
jgi:hypothetical protein